MTAARNRHYTGAVIDTSKQAIAVDAQHAVRGLDGPHGAFVLHAARSLLSGRDLPSLHEGGARLTNPEWTAVVAAARVHRVAPIVLAQAARADLLPLMPPSAAESLVHTYRNALLANRRAQSLLGRILSALAAYRVDAIVLKGVALAKRYYGELALRPSDDIDLLVHRDDIHSAVAALATLGYQPLPEYGHPSDFYALMNRTVVCLRSGNPTVELHWDFSNRPSYQPALDLSGAWQRSVGIMIEGQPTRYLHVRDDLTYLSVHCAAEHGMERLIWLIDIAQAMCSVGPDWDWDEYIAEITARRLALPLFRTLQFAHDNLGIALPMEVLNRLGTAAGSKQEVWAFRTARAERYSIRWLRAQAGALANSEDRPIFVRGAVRHVPKRLRRILMKHALYHRYVRPYLRLVRDILVRYLRRNA